MQGPGKTFDTSINWEEIDRRLSDDAVSLMADLSGSKQAKDDGGSAFPFEGGENNNFQPCYGMSLRDYFAAKAVTGLLADHVARIEGLNMTPVGSVAEYAYALADAMLRERAK